MRIGESTNKIFSVSNARHSRYPPSQGGRPVNIFRTPDNTGKRGKKYHLTRGVNARQIDISFAHQTFSISLPFPAWILLPCWNRHAHAFASNTCNAAYHVCPSPIPFCGVPGRNDDNISLLRLSPLISLFVHKQAGIRRDQGKQSAGAVHGICLQGWFRRGQCHQGQHKDAEGKPPDNHAPLADALRSGPRTLA